MHRAMKTIRLIRITAVIGLYTLTATPLFAQMAPVNGQVFQFEGNGHFYAWIDASLTWPEANAAAQDFTTVRNGVLLDNWHLVTITSQQENDFLAQTVLGLPDSWASPFGALRAWIGLLNEHGPNSFQWVTEESTSYTNWHPVEPNNSTGTVGTLGRYPDGTWNDEFDDATNGGFGLLAYLIEHNPLPLTTVVTVRQSTFDVDDEGWITNPRDAPGTLTHQSTGGNPGGFLRVDDTLGVNVFSFLLAPGKFTGNLSSAIEQTMSFDSVLLQANIDSPLDVFGTITIGGVGDSASLDIAPTALPMQWTTYSASLNAATWGKTQEEWESILANVRFISVALEPIGGANEVVGFDNFNITTVFEDRDDDGIPDDEDECLVSDLSSTILFNTCNSGVVNTLFTSGPNAGCTVADIVAEVLANCQ